MNTQHAHLKAAGLIALTVTGLFAAGVTEILNVSYDPTRELYKDFNQAFSAWYAKNHDGKKITNQLRGRQSDIYKEHDETFEKFRTDLAQRLRPAHTPEGIKADPILQGFRALHTKIGRSNRAFPSASEALAEQLGRRGIIPSINLLVDIYTCVSLETRLALGAHDGDTVDGHVTLRRTDGSERFVPLGATVPEPVFAGEYAYTDEAPEILRRMEVKQIEKPQVDLRTTDCFCILLGHTGTSDDDLRCAADRLTALTRHSAATSQTSGTCPILRSLNYTQGLCRERKCAYNAP